MNNKKTFIRVGEKNNFNFQDIELTELKKYNDKGFIFVNSNSFTTIKKDYPSIVTLNPYLVFNPLNKKSDTSNIKAFRIKVFITSDKKLLSEQKKCFEYAEQLNIPVLITFFRARSKKTVEQFKMIKSCYEYKGNYFRIKESYKTELIRSYKFSDKNSNFFNNKNIYICDSSGNGCPSCNNCTKLTFNKTGKIKALNLSCSGIADKKGKFGLCPFNCPDCFAKIVTYGYSPSCDKLIDNKKITGKINK